MLKLLSAVGLAVSAQAFAVSVPAVPESCFDELLERRTCAVYTAPATKGPVSITFFNLVYRSDFPEMESLRKRYLDFNQWPAYLLDLEETVIDFKGSLALESYTTLNESGEEVEVSPHFRDYVTKAPFPIFKLHIRHVINNWEVAAFEGADRSFEFAMEKGPVTLPDGSVLEEPEGLIEERGYIHETPCLNTEFCDEGMFMIIFDGVIHPKTDILPRVTAPYIKQTIEDFLRSQLLIL